ncbi:MAG: HEPN domain-containing protein [Deltaproteobacteria bacterium]|nr:HEPN domain-containing protein [Deltaproteobacteria bacterium]
MSIAPTEWLKQADYDLETAEFMFGGGRYFYAVFMCHQAVEKAIKGLYRHKLGETPPRVHNLVYLLSRVDVSPAEKTGKFIVRLNEANIATRYPDDLEKLQSDYTKEAVREVLDGSKEVIQWIKKRL